MLGYLNTIFYKIKNCPEIRFEIGAYTFNINNNSTHTNSSTVTLNLLGSGIDTMCISNTESCTNYVLLYNLFENIKILLFCFGGLYD